MAQEVLMKTHLIVTDIQNDYYFKWVGKILNTKPQFKNNKLIFIIVGGNGRMEINTNDMTRVEKCAKMMSLPKGRTAVTSDTVRIYIREVEIVDDNFHSRFSAFYKHYDYLVNDGPYSPLLRNYCYQIHDRLDEELMRKATKILEGTHDFTSFNATSISEIENQVRTIYKIDVERRDNMVRLSFYGDGFLRYMVRILSRCLIEVGLQNLSLEQLQKMLLAKNKQVCSYNCAAEGLYLIEVSYLPY